jgi:hypothetical protein
MAVAAPSDDSNLAKSPPLAGPFLDGISEHIAQELQQLQF